jgi:hypothetical protein
LHLARGPAHVVGAALGAAAGAGDGDGHIGNPDALDGPARSPPFAANGGGGSGGRAVSGRSTFGRDMGTEGTCRPGGRI